MFEAHYEGKISVENSGKMCHNPAKIFKIEKRGFIREGYYADLVKNAGLPWA
jgi:dihydroorotase